MLVREGVINRSQLYDALRLQRQNNRLLGTCLLSLGYISAERLLQILSEQLQVPVLPPGSLKWASPEAVKRVPAELALSLRIVPYSWDGQMIGVAVADGRVLEHLHDVAKYANAAVGAYIALEMEIEAALGKLYGIAAVTGNDADQAEPLPGRPRPMRVEMRVDPKDEVPSRDFGSVLGIDDSFEPVVLQKRKAEPMAPSAPKSAPPATSRPTPSAPTLSANPVSAPTSAAVSPKPSSVAAPAAPAPAASTPTPPAATSPAQRVSPAPAQPAIAPTERPPEVAAPAPLPKPRRGPPGPPLERLSFYAAVEQIYAATTPDEVGCVIGRAMLNYFERVLVLAVRERQLILLGYGGAAPVRSAVALEAVPEVMRGLTGRAISYGRTSEDPRGPELCDIFGIDDSRTALLASVSYGAAVWILAYADNGSRNELYDELHDVELLFKEAETALGMLLGP
jgi:hypothetical protein